MHLTEHAVSTRMRDPLLEPLRLKGLTLRNRLMSTSHACGLEEGGYPTERYQAYHEEKARGGIALTMFRGSSNVAPDSPNIFRQLNVGVDVVDCSSGGLTNTATAQPIPRHPGFQVPFASAVRTKGGVKSMAVGLILDGRQAEAVLRDGHADLIAIGRQALYDPFWALHAAQELGCDPGFTMWPAEYGWWLEKRSKTLVLPKAAE